MNTYVKQPTYRIWPPEPCIPVVLVDTTLAPFLLGVRGNRIPGRDIAPLVNMDHFTYVRQDFRDIEFKFHASATADGVPGRKDWLTEVWPNIPHVENFHPSEGFELCWRGIREVSVDDLPLPAQPVARLLQGTNDEQQPAAQASP